MERGRLRTGELRGGENQRDNQDYVCHSVHWHSILKRVFHLCPSFFLTFFHFYRSVSHAVSPGPLLTNQQYLYPQ
jgi:hypothetical protein